MYWIYLIIFILAVLVPDIVPTGSSFFSVNEEKIEELLIFSLGLIGFLIFRWKEKQSKINLEEKIKAQRETSVISKDLTDTYSYIGETNRKLDLMKNISVNLLKISLPDSRKRNDFFDSIMEAVSILGKSNKFIIRFINTETKGTEQEIKSKSRLAFSVKNDFILDNFLKKGNSFIENKDYFIVTSPKEIDKIVSAIIISKNNQQQKLEDPEIMKALAAQSLFLYCLPKTASQ